MRKENKHNQSKHMLKRLSNTNENVTHEEDTPYKNNFGPLKHETERVYNQNIYSFCLYRFKTIITWLFTNAQFLCIK